MAPSNVPDLFAGRPFKLTSSVRAPPVSPPLRARLGFIRCGCRTRHGKLYIRLPPSSPNLIAYAERFLRSIKSECLSKLVLLGEGHLRAAVHEYLAHSHQERNHQGLGRQLIVPPANLNRSGPTLCRERLGGLLRFYDREAA